MTTARVISEKDIVPNRAAGYQLVDGQLKNRRLGVAAAQHHRRRRPLPHGARHGGMGNRARKERDPRSRNRCASTRTPVTLNDGSTAEYGFGWGVTEMRGQRVIQHKRTMAGFRLAHRLATSTMT